ncbi:cyclomaltodextrinase C-terminal domain-containing protein [Pseudobowmanella zhangzhouensis]
MPDLNQRNPLLATYLIQNSIWWIETAKLSGIRLDTYSYPDSAFLSEYTRRVMQEYPNFSMVGEEWSTNPAIVSYWQRGTKRHDGYQSALSSLMDFPLQDAVVKGLTAPETWSSGISSIYQTLANDFVYGNANDLVVFPDNHDMSRIFSQLNEDIALTKMALAFYATTRGTPQYFYGTEILMKNPGTDDHGVIRSDFPGGWPDDKVNGFNGKGLTAEQAGMQAWLRQLLNWRKTSAAVTSGELVHYIPYDGTYVYFRVADKQRVMVVLNKGQARTVPMSYFHAMLGDAKQGKDVMLGSDVALSGDLALDAKSVRIIEF